MADEMGKTLKSLGVVLITAILALTMLSSFGLMDITAWNSVLGISAAIAVILAIAGSLWDFVIEYNEAAMASFIGVLGLGVLVAIGQLQEMWLNVITFLLALVLMVMTIKQ